MNNKNLILVFSFSALMLGSLLFSACNCTEKKCEKSEGAAVDTLKNYVFQTPDSLLKTRVHWFEVDGWEFEAEVIKVAENRVRVYNEEYKREFGFPLALLSDETKLILREWQAYNDLNKPETEADAEKISVFVEMKRDTIRADTNEYEVQTVNIPLKEIVLRVEFTYQAKNRELANRMLGLLKRAIPDYEKQSGIPFPGFNPYMVTEMVNGGFLGLAGPSDAYLCSLDKASEWTLLHEFVHIWNVRGRPHWISEGLADYIGYMGMIKYGGNFMDGENFDEDMEFWEEFKNTEEDFPLHDSINPRKYDYTYAGTKAMVFWKLVNEKYGDGFVNACFRKISMDEDFTNLELRELLKKHGEKNTDKVLSGWIIKGDYQLDF